MLTKEKALELLRENNQEHVMNFFDQLPEENKTEFLNQIENINWSDFKLIGSNEAASRGEFSVPPAVSISEIAKKHDEFEAIGLEAIKKGEVGRVHEFALIKNLHGVDSVDSAKELLKQNGVVI